MRVQIRHDILINIWCGYDISRWYIFGNHYSEASCPKTGNRGLCFWCQFWVRKFSSILIDFSVRKPLNSESILSRCRILGWFISNLIPRKVPILFRLYNVWTIQYGIRASHCEGAKNNSVVFFWKFALVLRKPKFSLLSTTKFKIQNDHSVEFVGGLSFVQTDAMMLADLWRW